MFLFWFSWYRKRFVKTTEIVPFSLPVDSKDTLRSMTVIPYIEDLHRGVPSDEEDEYEEEHLFTTAVHPKDGNGTQNHTHSMYKHFMGLFYA